MAAERTVNPAPCSCVRRCGSSMTLVKLYFSAQTEGRFLCRKFSTDEVGCVLRISASSNSRAQCRIYRRGSEMVVGGKELVLWLCSEFSTIPIDACYGREFEPCLEHFAQGSLDCTCWSLRAVDKIRHHVWIAGISMSREKRR